MFTAIHYLLLSLYFLEWKRIYKSTKLKESCNKYIHILLLLLKNFLMCTPHHATTEKSFHGFYDEISRAVNFKTAFVLIKLAAKWVGILKQWWGLCKPEWKFYSIYILALLLYYSKLPRKCSCYAKFFFLFILV